EETSAVDDSRLLAPPVETRLEPPLEPDRAFQPLDSSRELQPRQKAAVLQRQSLRDAHDAVTGAKRRLENVRATDVAARGFELRSGRQREASAALGIEQRAEGRRGLETRQRHEVDRAVLRDQGDRPPVAD